MNNPIKISIIVPVYNVQDYLADCLNSILSQTFANYEVIIVNDGSTDSSPQIIDSFKTKFPNLKIIHQKNQGVSNARNTGIIHSEGEYLFFLDSDDKIKPTTLEKLYRGCEQSKVPLAICGIELFNEFGSISKFIYKGNNLINSADLAEDILIGRMFSWVWNKLYRKDIWEKNSLSFKEGAYYEDIEIIFRILKCYSPIFCVPEALYEYRVRPGSIVASHSEKKITDFIKNVNTGIQDINKVINKRDWLGLEFIEIYRKISNIYAITMMSTLDNPSNEIVALYKSVFHTNDNFKFLLSNKVDIRNKLRFIKYNFLMLPKFLRP